MVDGVKYYRVCRVRCKRCGNVLEHVNSTKDENASRVMYCTCGAVGLDPSATLYRILGNSDDYTDLSEEWRDHNSQLRTMLPQDRTVVRDKKSRHYTDEERE